MNVFTNTVKMSQIDLSMIKRLLRNYSVCVKLRTTKKIEEMGQRLRYHLDQCKVVIPHSIVMKKCINLERWLLINTGEDKKELCEKILKEVVDDVGTKEIIETSVQQCITKQNLNSMSTRKYS